MVVSHEPLPDFSDVRSGSSSESAPRFVSTEVLHTVVRGDSLSRMAKEYYGDPTRWREIQDANRELVKNPDLIEVGWVLRIPQL